MRILLLCSVLLLLGALPACGSRWKARQFSPPDRDEWQQPERVIKDIALRPGQTVADVGAGGGYFTFRLSEAVGPRGRVIAVDLDPGMLQIIQEEAADRGATNVSVHAGQAEDPGIPVPVDLVFLANTYHHIENPAVYFRGVRRYLKPGGRLVIIDFNAEGFFHDFLGHGADADAVSRALDEGGYRRARRFEYLSNQHFQIFEPR